MLRKIKRNLRVYNNTRKPYDPEVIVKAAQNRYDLLKECGYTDNEIESVVGNSKQNISTPCEINSILDDVEELISDIKDESIDKTKAIEVKAEEVPEKLKEESIDKTKAVEVEVEEVKPETVETKEESIDKTKAVEVEEGKPEKLEEKTVVDNKAKMKNGFAVYSEEAKVVPETYNAQEIINKALKKDVKEETKKEFDEIKTKAKKNVEKLRAKAKANKNKSKDKKNVELVNEMTDEEIIAKAIEDLTKDIICSDKEKEIEMLKGAFTNKALVEIYRNKYRAEAKTQDIKEENEKIIKDNKQKVDNKVKEDKQEKIVDKGEKKGVEEIVEYDGDDKPNYKTEKIDDEEYVYLPIQQDEMYRLVSDVKKKYDAEFNKSINRNRLQRTIVGILADTGILEKAKTYNQLYKLTIKEMNNLIDTNTVELANNDKSDDELLNHLNSIFE